jgi:predicted PhzF superfamily epimerase YddE/YHI9
MPETLPPHMVTLVAGSYASAMRLFGVDAFADEVFGGNPAAVCLLGGPAEPGWMQAVAAEMNLSETAFVEPAPDGYRLRWFTPATEVRLCGHATLASAHVLYETGLAIPPEPVRFQTASGQLTARPEDGMLVLDFPARPASPAPVPPGLLAALGAGHPEWTGRSDEDVMVVLGSEQEVTGLQPDILALAAAGARGIIVTAPGARPGADFVSRFFAPAVGIDEDPVTGSAHCTLAPYWAHRLGRTSLTGYQASARGGTIRVRLDGERVQLAGRAVTVFSGHLSSEALPRPVR